MSSIFETVRAESENKLKVLKDELAQAYPENKLNNNICIYACGSLGRLEMTENSDLDLFFIADNTENDGSSDPSFSVIDKYNFFARLYQINHKLGYKDPSKGGEYWDFISKKNLLDIGSRQEDFNNSFTARMLLILESKPLYNEPIYSRLVEDTINKYYADYAENCDDFHPLFLMNDILRYWYTLTLNYEYRRGDHDDNNKKNWKRLKLKYARLITCYSMLACLYSESASSKYVIECIGMTPFERINMISKGNAHTEEVASKIEKEYEWFLALKAKQPDWWENPSNKESAIKHADKFHDLVVNDFMKHIAERNPELRRRADTY